VAIDTPGGNLSLKIKSRADNFKTKHNNYNATSSEQSK
jgi:hypothetical protein